MKLGEKGTSNIIETEDEFQSTNFSIDQENMKYVFDAFINYSDKIGSIVREITSNAFDAHVEAGVDKPVEIEMVDDNPITGQSRQIVFRDFGVGLSPERVDKIYSKFFESTKRDTNNQLGCYGVGAKSPMAYTDMYNVISNYDNTKYTYAIHKTKEGPTIHKIDEEYTDEENGTSVVINIKDISDKIDFKNALKEQLILFENINYINCDITIPDRIKTNLFTYIPEYRSNYLTVSMGNVVYEVDISKIGIETKHYPDYNNFILNFEIGELDLVWNRENVEYTDKTKQAIKERVENVKDKLFDLYKKQQKDEKTTFLTELEARNGKSIAINLSDSTITVGQHSLFYFNKSTVLDEQYVKYIKQFHTLSIFKNVRRFSRHYKSSTHETLNITTFKLHENKYLLDDKINKYTNSYLLNKLNTYLVYKLYTLDEYIEFVEKYFEEQKINPFDKEHLTNIYNWSYEYIKDDIKKYDDIEVPGEFVKTEKKKEEIEANIQHLSYTEYYGGTTNGHRNKFQFNIKEETIDDFFKRKFNNKIVVFDNQKNKDKLFKVSQVFSTIYKSEHTLYFTCNKKLAAYLEDLKLPNVIRASNADNSKYTYRAFNKLIDAYYIDRQSPTHSNNLLKNFCSSETNVYITHNTYTFIKRNLEELTKKYPPSQSVKQKMEENEGLEYKFPYIRFINSSISKKELYELLNINPNLNLSLYGRLKQRNYEKESSSSEE